MCNCWSWWWINKHSHVGQFNEHIHGCTEDPASVWRCWCVLWMGRWHKHLEGWSERNSRTWLSMKTGGDNSGSRGGQRRVEPSRADQCQLQGGWNGCLSSTPSISSIITHFLELIFPIALGSELSPSYLMKRETQGRGVTGLTPDAEAPHLCSVLVRAGWGSGPST